MGQLTQVNGSGLAHAPESSSIWCNVSNSEQRRYQPEETVVTTKLLHGSVKSDSSKEVAAQLLPGETSAIAHGTVIVAPGELSKMSPSHFPPLIRYRIAGNIGGV